MKKHAEHVTLTTAFHKVSMPVLMAIGLSSGDGNTLEAERIDYTRNYRIAQALELTCIKGLKGKRVRFVAILLIVTLMGSILPAPALTLAQDQTSGTDSSDGIGIQVASWALTVPYCLAKTAFAVGGGIVGGLGYVFSGGNSHTAQAIWTTSITGTYIIRPAHLRGEEPVRFLGHAGENQGESVPHPIEPVPNSSASPKKK